MKLSRLTAAGLALGAGEAALAIYVWLEGPTGRIPMHFGWNGEVNRWGDRAEAAGWIGVMALFSAAASLGLDLLSRPANADRTPSASLDIAKTMLLAVGVAVCALTASLAFGWLGGGGVRMNTVMMGGLGALFAGIGAYLGKVAPNPLVGVRTPWTYGSRLAWDKANRLAGRLFFWGGLAALAAAPVAPEPLGMKVLLGGVAIAAAVSIVESWRVWRSDPERKSWS